MLLLLHYFFKCFIHALFSGGFWAGLWIVTFLVSNYLISELTEASVTITAAVLTITVVAGYVPKLLGYAIGVDNDFKHIFLNEYIREPKVARFVFASLLLGYAVFTLADNISASLEDIEVMSKLFIDKTRQMAGVVLPLFFAQVVFSWPEAYIMKQNG